MFEKIVLKPLFLSKSKLSNYRYLTVVAFLLIIFSIFSYIIGNKVSLDGDFNVFWQAGKNYLNGVSLYSQIGGAERFIYPPFAAMSFQFFALFSLHQAAAIFCFFNFLFWIMIIYYTQHLLLFYKLNPKQINYALLIAFILSLRYFLYHIKFIQMNEIVLLMSLAGIYHFLHHKINTAIILLVIATFIKIIPLFILLLILSKCNYKKYFLTFFCVIICIVLPVLMRGKTQGFVDIHEYYITFLAPFQHGRVEPKLQNYGLEAALYKLFSYTDNGNKYNYIITILSPETINLIYKIIIGFLLVAFAIIVFPFKTKKQIITLHEICFVLLFTHLLSGITWEYHLVTLFFVIAVLTMDYFNAPKKYRLLYYILGIILLFNSIIGTSTIGTYLYYKSCGFSLLTWLLLVLAIYSFGKYFYNRWLCSKKLQA
ncbi:MAG TPA: glycosyltransferase family 87 protein [Bacteroidia bacterium]|nr:glycosyltransferase family 87 protein [Bacteroidia bacterium]